MKKPIVLIVEDDQWMADQYKQALSSAEYEVRVTHNALDAITDIDTHLPDVILLDVLLSVTTGFALLHELQSYGDTGRIPIVLCSNLTPDLILEDLRPYGVRRMLDKSAMTPEDIRAAIKSVLI